MADSLYASESTVSYPLHISGITVNFNKPKTNIESAELRIGKLHSPIACEAGNRSLQHKFSPPMVLSQGDTFSLHIQSKKWLGMKTKHRDITFNPDDVFRAYSASERREYTKIHEKINIVIDLSGSTTTEAEQSISSGQSLELRPTTSELFRKCPRFRILVIGKTGVGKSSVINHAFGVENTITSHYKPGEVSIDHEFISPENDKFVLHDSKGFEPGDEDNLKIVEGFIDRRRNMLTPEHQLHAIWLCFEIPRAGGRLLETGTEDFLKLKSSGKLGNVPVVVVLTKYDMLIGRIERNLDETSANGLNDKAIKEVVKNKAEAELQNTCIGPLKQFAGPDIPYVTISSVYQYSDRFMRASDCKIAEADYKQTLVHLIEITESRVGRYSAPEAAVMTSIAQRVHPGLKIKASIEVGKKRYWKALGSCPMFKNRSMWDCLRVLHIDIVDVWNFRDPHKYLHSQEFRTMMMNMVDKIEVGPATNPTKTMAFGLSMVGTIAAIVSALAGPAAPIVVPIAVGAVLAVWAYDVYQISHAVLQRFMAYIIHLTLVLQTLYLISESQELTRRAIKLAVNCYIESPMSGEANTRIQDYDDQLTIVDRMDSDALDKIVEVMQFYSIDEAQMSKLREKPHVDLPDEPWS